MIKAPAASADIIIFGVVERENVVLWTVRRCGVRRRGLFQQVSVIK